MAGDKADGFQAAKCFVAWYAGDVAGSLGQIVLEYIVVDLRLVGVEIREYPDVVACIEQAGNLTYDEAFRY